jgi:TolA-binding protein
MKKIPVFLLVFVIISSFLFAQAQDRRVRVTSKEKRMALVIGNNNYSKGKLANAVNDARSMRDTLREFGFSVIYMENVDLRKIITGVQSLERKLQSGGVGLFCFSGHGFQIDGLNYLLPIGANVESEADVKFECYPADRVLESMTNAGNRLNIVILDACRDNPFVRSFSRSSRKGLAQMNSGKGMYIAYATSPGDTASDGPGMRNGLFTYHLLKSMKKPGLTLEQVFKMTREVVNRVSKGKQFPWTSSSIIGEFVFLSKDRYSTQTLTSTYKPKLPSTTKVDLSDIEAEARKNRLAKQKEKKAWSDWQQNFQSAVDKAKQIDKDENVSPVSKKEAWQRILNAYLQNNPYSLEDEQFRKYARERVYSWTNYQQRKESNQNMKLQNVDPKNFYNKGIILLDNGKCEEAIKEFKKAIEIDPNFADACYQLGMCYLSMANTPQALKCFKKFMKIAPKSPNFEVAKSIVESFEK